MLATMGGPGDPGARDPVDRESSRVQAAAVFYPFTDLLNYGVQGLRADRHTLAPPLNGAFDFRELDPVRGLYIPITDEKRLTEISRDVSPISHVSADTPPVLLIHGDKDLIVPLQQSELMLGRLRACGVPARLIVQKGGGHGWPKIEEQTLDVADWFDRYLAEGKGLSGR
jgi:acetyl esterase/lipase